MKNIIEHAEEFVRTENLKLAAANLQHLLKIQQEQTSLEAITESLQQTIINAHGNAPYDLCDMMVVQARILDATFHYFVDKSKDKYTEPDKLAFALKAQQQTVRTALAWKKLKSENYVVRKIVPLAVGEKKHAERTEQNAPLDT